MDAKVGIYPELKSARAGNLVLSSRGQNTTVEQLLIDILHRWKIVIPTLIHVIQKLFERLFLYIFDSFS